MTLVQVQEAEAKARRIEEWKQKFFRWWYVFERTGLWLSRRQRLQLRVARWRMAATAHARYQQECIHRASRAAAARKIQAFRQGHTVRKLIGTLQRKRARATSSCSHELCCLHPDLCYIDLCNICDYNRVCEARAKARRNANPARSNRQKFFRWWCVIERTGLWLFRIQRLQLRVARWHMAAATHARYQQGYQQGYQVPAEDKAKRNAAVKIQAAYRGLRQRAYEFGGCIALTHSPHLPRRDVVRLRHIHAGSLMHRTQRCQHKRVWWDHLQQQMHRWWWEEHLSDSEWRQEQWGWHRGTESSCIFRVRESDKLISQARCSIEFLERFGHEAVLSRIEQRRNVASGEGSVGTRVLKAPPGWKIQE